MEVVSSYRAGLKKYYACVHSSMKVYSVKPKQGAGAWLLISG